jgi:hypothetical protein
MISLPVINEDVFKGGFQMDEDDSSYAEIEPSIINESNIQDRSSANLLPITTIQLLHDSKVLAIPKRGGGP